MGRSSIGERPMTPAERKARMKARVKEHLSAINAELHSLSNMNPGSGLAAAAATVSTVKKAKGAAPIPDFGDQKAIDQARERGSVFERLATGLPSRRDWTPAPKGRFTDD